MNTKQNLRYILQKKLILYENDKTQNGRRLFEKLYISTQKKKDPDLKKYTNSFNIIRKSLSIGAVT